MPLLLEDQYKLILESHKHASDFRMKILELWISLYTALAIAFSWIYTVEPNISWIISSAALLVTVFMWLLDFRNRGPLFAAKDIGVELEKVLGIDDDHRFFNKIAPSSPTGQISFSSHSTIINIIAALMGLLFIVTTLILMLKALFDVVC